MCENRCERVCVRGCVYERVYGPCEQIDPWDPHDTDHDEEPHYSHGQKGAPRPLHAVPAAAGVGDCCIMFAENHTHIHYFIDGCIIESCDIDGCIEG